MHWYWWVVVIGAAFWLSRQSLRGRCWNWVPDPNGYGEKFHARTKLIRMDYGPRCNWCGSAYQMEPDMTSRYPIGVVRLWECRCGEMWSEKANENAKEYAERMADLTIAEDEKKPIVTPPPKAAP